MSNIKKRINPLIHMITNYVTMNDLAQVAICYGGRPLMATHHDEINEITGCANGLLINIGTLETYNMEASRIALEVANHKRIPTVFDPVGVQASTLRKQFASSIIKEYCPTLIKGNLAEIKTLIGETSKSIGIDSLETYISNNTKNTIVEYAKEFNAIIVVTGEEDFITDGFKSARVSNGVSRMADITGTGCMLGILLTVALSFYDHKESRFNEVVKAVISWGICGELAEESLGENEGLITFKHRLLDNISLLTDEIINERKKVIYES